MSPVAVTLLGGFEVAVDGAAVPDSAWRLKKARELVKLLALAPSHRLHREQAMDVLWRERAPAAAANNLNQAVHVARRVLGAAAIESRDDLLVLAADVDVDRFVAAAADAGAAGTRAGHRAALALYRGELLPENRYDDWAERRREELGALAAGLERELAELDAAPQSGLPASASSFVGRARELAQLAESLQRTRLLTLTGVGGVGKTRLALELAHRVEHAYDAGAALVELDALTDGRLLPDAVAAALDVRALASEPALDAVVGFLGPRELLLVLDNCEHLLGPAATLADALLRRAPRLTILATSREPLRVDGEAVFRVPSLEIADPALTLTPAELAEYESASLFLQRASAVDPGFALDEANVADVARICFRLDGLPLALELAAARLGALDAAAIAARLDARFDLLRTGLRSAPTRQQTLAATLEWSHDLLEPDESALFRRLGVFAGGFELDAVEEVCGDEDAGGRAGAADVLARLVEKSLVVVEDAGGRRRYRYRLLETVRLYALARLEQAREHEAVAERQARWALELAVRERGSTRLDREEGNLRAALRRLQGRAPHDALRLCVALLPFWLRRIELAEAERQLATALAADEDPSPLRAQALLAAAAVHFRSGALDRGVVLAQQAYEVAAELGDAEREWRALQFLGEFAVATDAVEAAVEWLERALAVARREGFAAGEAIGVHSLGVAAWVAGDLPGADELVGDSIDRFRALAGSSATIPSPLNIAEVRISRSPGRPGVRHIFEDTLQPLVEIGCDAAAAYALANRAAIARMRGDLPRARRLLEESAAVFAAAGDRAGRATVLVRQAYIALAERDVDVARARLEDALELRERLEDRRGCGVVLSGLGLVATTGGDYDTADAYLARAGELFRRAGDRWGLASTLWRVADVAHARGDLDAAEAALREALQVVGETRRDRWIAATLAALAEVVLARGDLERGAELLAEARDRYAARADAPGVAAVDERLRSLLSAR